MRILFVLKKRHGYGDYSAGGPSSGLFNSAQFVCDMLRDKLDHTTKLVVVQDNNDIDREVTLFRPFVVVIEALWITPDKFDILHRKHPLVNWVVRNHSALPFLAHEGSAMEWLLSYSFFPNVVIACNDLRTRSEFTRLLAAQGVDRPVAYLPNYYPPKFIPRQRSSRTRRGPLDIGCFGALRPLKNQLIQAVAAVRYAERIDKNLRFHINGSRIEGGAEPILKNLRQMFAALPGHRLIEHPWEDREGFINLVRRMDLGLQVSMSETFNVIAADFVTNDTPIVVSPEVSWMHPKSQASPTDSEEIARALQRAHRMWAGHFRKHLNIQRLREHDKIAVAAWRRLATTYTPLSLFPRGPATR